MYNAVGLQCNCTAMQYSVPYLPPVVQVLWNHQPSILQCSAKGWQCYSSVGVPVFHQNYSYNATD